MESELRLSLANLVGWAHAKGWTPGTGGNFGCVLSADPLRLLVTPSGLDKGTVTPESLIIVDDAGAAVGEGNPSAETLLHVAIARQTGAPVIAHIHSIWNTLASLSAGDTYEIEGYEMLKGLAGVKTHEHREHMPIVDNTQDIPAMSSEFRRRLANPEGRVHHAILIRGHGLYTWGHNFEEVRRHLEILEFLFELTIRLRRME